MAQGIHPSRVVSSKDAGPAYRVASASPQGDLHSAGFLPDPPFLAVQQMVVSL